MIGRAMSLPAVFISKPLQVLPEWIDFNGHLNMAYYALLFDLGADQAFAELGFGPDYALTRRMTTYAADFRIRYLKELHVDAKVTVGLQLLDADEKRFHFCQWLWHEDGWLAATGEGLTLHIDMTGPRVAPFPPDIAENIAKMRAHHAQIAPPDFIAKPIGIHRHSNAPH